MRARALCLFVAVIGAAALVSASGAATPKANQIAHINVSTRAAVVRYLRSIHVNPRGVVIQRGARNYAGASCPGTGWTCASTRHTVVQVARAGGRNRFACSTGRCSVVQFAPLALPANNFASCVKTAGLAQACAIAQTTSSGTNTAVVYEKASTNAGLSQSTNSNAVITQKATSSGSNNACVYQETSLTNSSTVTKGALTLTQESHQSVTVKQDSASGPNLADSSANSGGGCDGSAPITQVQTLTGTSTGPVAVTQKQNAANKGANMTIDIEQNEGAANGIANGTNDANFTQTNTLTAVANSNGGPIAQTQSSVNGGLLGTINQDTTGVSTATTTQTETQCEDAAKTGLSSCDHPNDADASEAPSSLTQTQFGPVHKGVGTATQTGDNPGDTFSISQTSTQDNDQGPGSHQTNDLEGDCSTPGDCTVTQTTVIDGQTNENTASGQDVDTTTNCTGSDCSSTGGGPSFTTLPNGISASNVDVGEFGVGGMRGDGTGTIDVSGITGPVERAYLYWHGPTNSENPASNADVMFNNSPVSGTNIGTDYDNFWGFQNSQSYRADVTDLVTGLEEGSASYNLSDFVKSDESGTIADINGVSLVVFYDDGDAFDNRNVVLWNGNDSNCGPAEEGFSTESWDQTLSGVLYPGSGAASLDFIVSDGQTFDDPQLLLNGNELVAGGSIFQGDSVPPNQANGLWDVKGFDMTSFLQAGSNNLNITTGGVPDGSWDCLSLVVAIANTPTLAPQEEIG
jgi:hypothetical protein